MGRKSKKCSLCLRIGTHRVSKMLIFIPKLVFWISIPKSTFGQIWTKKFKVVRFPQKIAHKVSRECWFLFRHSFSEFSTLTLYLGIFGPQNYMLYVLPENWHTEYLNDVDSYSILVFWNSKPTSFFWANLSRESVLCLEADTESISKM